MAGKLLITGATGFIGFKLAEFYTRRGMSLRLLVRDPARLHPELTKCCEIIIGDLTQPESLTPALRGVDSVIHAAGMLGHWGMTYQQLWEINVIGSENLVQAACRERVSRFIHLSAGGVTGPVESNPADETFPPRPRTDYERSKWEGEQRVLEIAADHNFNLLVVRPTFTYGPGDPHKLELFRAVQKGRFAFVGRGLSTVSPVFIDDLIKGIDLALGSDLRLTSVILAGDRPVTKRELIWGIADTLEVKRPRLMIPAGLAMLAAYLCEFGAGILKFKSPLTASRVLALSRHWGYSIEKADLMLGYQPGMDLARGLQLTVGWYREQGWL
jgi:nucleoside-diphosphate-sugar epimerase